MRHRQPGQPWRSLPAPEPPARACGPHTRVHAPENRQSVTCCLTVYFHSASLASSLANKRCREMSTPRRVTGRHHVVMTQEKQHWAWRLAKVCHDLEFVSRDDAAAAGGRLAAVARLALPGGRAASRLDDAARVGGVHSLKVRIHALQELHHLARRRSRRRVRRPAALDQRLRTRSPSVNVARASSSFVRFARASCASTLHREHKSGRDM